MRFGNSWERRTRNATPEQRAAGWGDAWTWVALDADSKLWIPYLIGGRDAGWATDFAFDEYAPA